jgi:hypothetical protein
MARSLVARKRSRMRYLCGLLLLTAANANAQRLDTLYVGKAPLSAAYMRNDSSQSIVVVPDSGAPGGQRTIGRITTRQRVEDNHGTQVLFRVSHFTGTNSEVTDSSMTRGSGLVPIWETSHQTSKLMHLRWDGRHTTGDVTPTGKATVTIDQTTAVAPFNSSDIELVIASLPLSLGYRQLLATYEYESGGLRLDTLAVTGRDRDTWVVRVSRGDSSSLTFWCDPRAQRVVKMEVASKPHSWDVRILRQ